MPGDAIFATDLTATGPADLFETADEFCRELGGEEGGKRVGKGL